MTVALKIVDAVARAVCAADRLPEELIQEFARDGWGVYGDMARVAIAETLRQLRDRPGIIEEACRKAADPSGRVCWKGITVHRAADVVDAVLGAMGELNAEG